MVEVEMNRRGLHLLLKLIHSMD